MERPRYNQPSGYRPTFGGTVQRYYGRRHDYIFFPVAWTDTDTGQSYESGYYDENGVRYENVSVAKNGQYENVVCACPYCGNQSIITLSASAPGEQSLTCPVCGATMEIRSALDDYLDADGAESYSAESYGEYDSRAAAYPQKKRRTGLLIGIIVAIAAIAGLVTYGSRAGQSQGGAYTTTTVNTTEGQGGGAVLPSEFSDNTIYLSRSGNLSYTISDTVGDKTLIWDADADSYYDADTECWLWYNADVEPAVWQYWYEGISSDYGDYGWMEHYDDGWFIEEDYGSWIPLPDTYDASRLWYIE